MRDPADPKVRTSGVLLGVPKWVRGCQSREATSRRELIRAGLLGSGVLLIRGVDLGRWLSLLDTEVAAGRPPIRPLDRT
jgi:hypothetical protein